jgi:sulfoxide reductase catalytic subunit YedY
MIIKRPDDIPSSEITPEGVYVNRRQFLARAGLIGASVASAASLLEACKRSGREYSAGGEVGSGEQQEKLTSYEDITTYNNFYEFGMDKSDPAEYSGDFKPKPWTVRVEGLVKKAADYDFDDLIKPAEVQDRTYRLRCVEAWSMVIPWQGVPLASLIKRFEPLPSAKFVKFTTVFRPSEMPGQRTPLLDWPYVEGLRMDEAMNPLTILATGLYGKTLPNQDGAPLRLIVPWKYGFKGIKSIVKISFTDQQPMNTWQLANPSEYGFYANVNPNVDHPRWTQASERRIGQFRRLDTKMFNGYADQVASMYAGMDLRKYF